jgi:hypothetical protein
MIDLEKLRLMFEVDCNGQLVRRCTVHYNAKKGDIAGTVDKTTGYMRVNFDGKVHYVHRLVWALSHGELPNGFIDHINGIKTDNRISNLRVVDNRENMQNVRHARVDSKTGVLGVSFCKNTKKYIARIHMPDGSYPVVCKSESLDIAGQMYIEAKRKYHKGCTI